MSQRSEEVGCVWVGYHGNSFGLLSRVRRDKFKFDSLVWLVFGYSSSPETMVPECVVCGFVSSLLCVPYCQPIYGKYEFVCVMIGVRSQFLLFLHIFYAVSRFSLCGFEDILIWY